MVGDNVEGSGTKGKCIDVESCKKSGGDTYVNYADLMHQECVTACPVGTTKVEDKHECANPKCGNDTYYDPEGLTCIGVNTKCSSVKEGTYGDEVQLTWDNDTTVTPLHERVKWCITKA